MKFPGAAVAMCLATLSVAVAVTPAPTAAAPTGPDGGASVRNLVQDPHYGAALYDYFQEHHFEALGGLMSARASGRLPHHTDDAELLLGGLYLSYGMHERAARVFGALLSGDVRSATRERAWFHLGKLQYQRGQPEEAIRTFEHTTRALPPELAAERDVLNALIHMERGDPAAALPLLEAASKDPRWARFAQYNQGLALIRLGRTDEGLVVLDRLIALETASSEEAGLRDRACLTAAESLLSAQAAGRALGYYTRIRLHGLDGARALLGMGWAQARLGRWEEAMTPWDELLRSHPATPAAQEALIAIPHALARLLDHAQAARRYENAIASYQAEVTRLDQIIAAGSADRLAAILDSEDLSEVRGWRWQMASLPAIPEAGILLPLLASHGFQEAWKNYRDIVALNRWTLLRIADLDSYREMVVTRRAAFEARLPRVEALLADDRRMLSLRQRHEHVSSKLARVRDQNDVYALGSPEERDWHARLARLDANLPRLPRDVRGRAATPERLRRLRGLLYWRMNAAFPSRLWQIEHGRKQTEAALAEISGRMAGLRTARIEVARGFEGLDIRIDQARARLVASQGRIAASRVRMERHLGGLFEAALLTHRQRIELHLTHARLNLARIYDPSVGKDAP